MSTLTALQQQTVPATKRHPAPTTDSVSQAEQSERAAMISRQLLQCLQHPQLLHSVGPAAAAAATASTPLWATAASQLLGSTAAAGSTFSASVPGNWRGFSADAPSSSLPADNVPWSSGLASSSQRQVCMVTALFFHTFVSGSLNFLPGKATRTASSCNVGSRSCITHTYEVYRKWLYWFGVLAGETEAGDPTQAGYTL